MSFPGGYDTSDVLKLYSATYSSTANMTSVTFWAKNRQFLEIQGQCLFTGAGDNVAFTVALPGAVAGSPVIDTASLPGGAGTGNATASMCGPMGHWFDSGNGWLFVSPKFVTTTTVGFFMATQSLNGSQFASGDGLSFQIRVPIVGWT